MAMIAITTSSSIKVKPDFVFLPERQLRLIDLLQLRNVPVANWLDLLIFYHESAETFGIFALFEQNNPKLTGHNHPQKRRISRD